MILSLPPPPSTRVISVSFFEEERNVSLVDKESRSNERSRLSVIRLAENEIGKHSGPVPLGSVGAVLEGRIRRRERERERETGGIDFSGGRNASLLVERTPPGSSFPRGDSSVPTFIHNISRSDVVLSRLRPCRANVRAERVDVGRRQTESIQLVHKHPSTFTSIKRNKVLCAAHRRAERVPTMGGLSPFPRVMDFLFDGSLVNLL